MIPGVNNLKSMAALRAAVLLLFLPAHLAFVLLIDLNFIPVPGAGPAALQPSEERSPDKERLRVQLLRHSDSRAVSNDVRQAAPLRDLDPWTLVRRPSPEFCPGESVAVKLTKPAALRIWLAATPHNHRAPPA